MNTNCKAAFNDILLDHNGEILPCCYIQRAANTKTINDLDNIKDWFQSDKDIKSLRKNLSTGIKDTRCDHCWKSEADNKWTLRSANPFDSDKEEAKLLHITGGKLCNMACRMCSPELSSLIQAEKRPWQNVTDTSDYNWIDDPVQTEKLIKFINNENIQSIQLQGGEPQIMKGFVDILEKVESSKKSNIDLQVTTNASVFNEKFWKNAVKFTRVTAGISIDAVGSRYDIIRYRGNWNVTKENCNKILDYIWQNRINPGPNPALNLNIVIQLSNIDQGNEMSSFYHALERKFSGISCKYTMAHVFDSDQTNPWDPKNIPPAILHKLPDVSFQSQLGNEWQKGIDFAKSNNMYNQIHRTKVLAREEHFKNTYGKNLWDERPDWYEIYKEQV